MTGSQPKDCIPAPCATRKSFLQGVARRCDPALPEVQRPDFHECRDRADRAAHAPSDIKMALTVLTGTLPVSPTLVHAAHVVHANEQGVEVTNPLRQADGLENRLLPFRLAPGEKGQDDPAPSLRSRQDPVVSQ